MNFFSKLFPIYPSTDFCSSKFFLLKEMHSWGLRYAWQHSLLNLFLGIERIQCFEVVFWGVNLFSDMILEEGVFFQKMWISWVVYLDDSDDVTLGSIIHISYGSIVFVFCVDFQLCWALLWVIQSKGKGRGKVNYIWIFIYIFFYAYIYI